MPAPTQVRQMLAAKIAVHALLSTMQETKANGPAPEGLLYAGLMVQGCTLSQFQGPMGSMERTGMVSRQADQVEITTKGEESVARLASEIQKIRDLYPT